MTAKRRRAKGEGSIVQRKDGTWQYSLDLGKGADGRRRRRYFYAPTRPELLRKVADERARAGGSLKPRVPGTVGSWMTSWLEEMRGQLNPQSHVSYETAWRVHAEDVIGACSLEKFDVPEVEQLFRKLRDDGASPSVVNKVATILHRAFAVAIKRRAYLRPNPFALVDRPRMQRPETRVLEPAEVAAFLKAAKGDRYEALWVLLVTSGLRLGEALALRWSDVDLERRTITVSRSFLEISGRIEIGTTKNRGSRRLVTIGALAAKALKVRKRAAEREDHESELIFPTTIGTPLRRSNLRRSHFIPICKAAEIEGLRIHDLRHTMTSLALVAGLPAKVVAERLGHSTTRLTLDRYSHLLGDLQADAANAIDRALKPGRRPRKSPDRV